MKKTQPATYLLRLKCESISLTNQNSFPLYLMIEASLYVLSVLNIIESHNIGLLLGQLCLFVYCRHKSGVQLSYIVHYFFNYGKS